ncbi:hypothetical protein DEI92_03905 [Curtobacterium sp. MCBD17_034]|uniref:hypothetical protein n=1 Tax=unclassified Curtobacterium TaxID=257496 RepID=UPI000DA7E3C2|nr:MULTISPECIES: hypothetical protein [unclassified Curtobacterium]PZE75833.1 hypothetical protein DEI82_08055 [Curtobacterium sp. MCBD17_019]PZF60805.1 hypothetical protein DEI92_03905 [Curtobacterium sp. MCBD17_034]PZM40154.1 hypothetical protein DEI90_00140 [Curtobacterium sp. MCBD17_031]WIE56065.1 hypothetical protein DEI88_007710 [Curtobacterium sp. MCBD17_003]
MKAGLPVIALVGIVVGVLGSAYSTSGQMVLGWIMIVAGFATAAVAVTARVRENRQLLRRWADEDERKQD